MDDKNLNNENESNEAKKLRVLGGGEEEHDEEPLKIDKFGNFWYHYRFRIIMIAAFAFIIGIASWQFLTHQNPDISLIYAGPEYITANQNKAFCEVLQGMMPDYNGDGKKYAQLNDMIFMSGDQMSDYIESVAEEGETAAVDKLTNKQTSERFTYEIFGSESSICILAEDQYQSVASESGFMPLSEIFDEIPEGAIDEYGVRFSETKLCKFYDAAKIFPDDAVIALRRLSTMSVFTGKKKAEKKYEYNLDFFKKMLNFDYPEGYVPPEDTASAE